MIGKQVVVRTSGAGVHCGTLASRDGDQVILTNDVRIWRWRGANTLHEVALHGVDSAATSAYTRVSEAVPEIALTGVHEIIPMTDGAWSSVASAGWAE